MENILSYAEFVKESLPQQQTVDQLKKLRKITKGKDIGDRISDMNKQGANILYIHNPIDTGIESQEKYIASCDDHDTKSPIKNFKKEKKYRIPTTGFEDNSKK